VCARPGGDGAAAAGADGAEGSLARLDSWLSYCAPSCAW